jgi:hypothetical protein
MALTYQQAVEQTIIGAEQFHEIINGSATSEIIVEDGSKIPSVRKALIDNFYYKDPIIWQQGQSELVFNQIRKFTDGTWWVAPNATATNPVVMGVTPYGDPLWKVFSWDRVIEIQPQMLLSTMELISVFIAGVGHYLKLYLQIQLLLERVEYRLQLGLIDLL